MRSREAILEQIASAQIGAQPEKIQEAILEVLLDCRALLAQGEPQ